MSIPVSMLEAPVMKLPREENGQLVIPMTDGTERRVSLARLRSGHNIPVTPEVIAPGKSNQGPRIDFTYPGFGIAVPYSQIGIMRIDFTVKDESGGNIVALQYQLDNNTPVVVAITPTSLQQFSIPVPDLVPGAHKFAVSVTDNQGQVLTEFVRWLQEGVDSNTGEDGDDGNQCICAVDPVIVMNKPIYAPNDDFIMEIKNGKPNSPVVITPLAGRWDLGTISGLLDNNGGLIISNRIPLTAVTGRYAFKAAYADDIVRLLEIQVEE